jgi:lipopolysaccharide export system protein LptA
VEFAAEHLVLDFAAKMKINRITGTQNGKLISTTASLKTSVTTDALTLDFDPAAAEESILTRALAKGRSVLQAEPVNQSPAPDTRVLRSDVIRLNMRPGGQEIDKVETDGPGTVEFLPNRAGLPKRFMKGDQIWIAYGTANRIQSFRSVNVNTRTEKPAAPPMLTESKEMLASFDPESGELAKLDQNKAFKYQEGERRSTADRATLEQDLITLDGAARAWDPTGSANADRILLNQKSGDFTADGHVTTTHAGESDTKVKPGSAMLASNEVMQGKADHLVSTGRNQKLHYEGSANVWQGANRVQADKIDIDRGARTFEARGEVVSQLADKSPNTKSKAVFTVVRAPELTYSDETRLAHYKGGALMTRPDLSVTGQEIKAYLNEATSASSLDRAQADGAVKIVSTTAEPSNRGTRTRTGTGEHAEYYAAEQRVAIEGGEPLFVDSNRGKTQGRKLTWWANNDRLLVDGVESRPADTLLRKK